MKELSIEEKAKRYDEAIKRAKEINDEQRAQPHNVMTRVFPELAESDDERIRKDLIEFIKGCGAYSQEYIDWLEKQAGQKYTAEEILIKVGLKPYKDGDQWCVLLGDNIQEGICGFGNTIEDALYAFLKDLITSQGKQKPVDIPEDFEKLVEHLLNLSDGEGHGSPAKVKEVSAELLKLANQQKFIWSEEDEYYYGIIQYILNNKYVGKTDKENAINWFKSIKERV